MKLFVVCYLSTVLTASLMATPNREMQAVQVIHETWELAFEDADLDVIEKLWAHDGDVWLVTPLGTIHNGWASVKGALKNLFGLLGQTTIDTSGVFLTVDGDDASMTMGYQWSPLPGLVFRVTERYQKVEHTWKLVASDSQADLLPLRPDDEKAIKRLAEQVQKGLIDKDIATIPEVAANEFTFTGLNGARFDGWQASVEQLGADLDRLADLQLQSIALMEDQACAQYTLTQTDGNRRRVQLIFAGPDWKLKAICLNPDAKSFAIPPNGNLWTTLGQIKAGRRW